MYLPKEIQNYLDMNYKWGGASSDQQILHELHLLKSNCGGKENIQISKLKRISKSVTNIYYINFKNMKIDKNHLSLQLAQVLPPDALFQEDFLQTSCVYVSYLPTNQVYRTHESQLFRVMAMHRTHSSE